MKQRKLEPAVQTIIFSVPNGASTVDLSRCASLVNRRFYRQGINWVVAGFRFFKPGATPTTGTGVSVSRLPNTWVMANAWEKAFRHWQELNKRSVEAGESLPGRFTDFKIYMDSIHHGSVGTNSNLLPVDSSATPATPGEWEYSKIIIPDDLAVGGSRTFEMTAVGANFPGAGASGLNAVSLIEGYAASRALPSVVDPNTPGDASDTAGGTPENWLGAINNEGTSQISNVIEDLTTENNLAPYPFENMDLVTTDTQYPGGANQLPGLQFVDGAYFNATDNANKLYLKGDNFPCGLIRIDSNVTEGPVTMAVDLVPGTHRGYLCEPMTEM